MFLLHRGLTIHHRHRVILKGQTQHWITGSSFFSPTDLRPEERDGLETQSAPREIWPAIELPLFRAGKYGRKTAKLLLPKSTGLYQISGGLTTVCLPPKG